MSRFISLSSTSRILATGAVFSPSRAPACGCPVTFITKNPYLTTAPSGRAPCLVDRRRYHAGLMPIGTAFHARTSPLCESMAWRDWAGYFAVSTYEVHHDREYNAIRNAAALIDISPLFKYRVEGKDAARLVDRVVTRDVPKMAVGQVAYTHWCDRQGKVIDDGTVSRLGPELFRWTAAEPTLRWIRENAHGLDVQVQDITDRTASLALQGPTSREILKACT